MSIPTQAASHSSIPAPSQTPTSPTPHSSSTPVPTANQTSSIPTTPGNNVPQEPAPTAQARSDFGIDIESQTPRPTPDSSITIASPKHIFIFLKRHKLITLGGMATFIVTVLGLWGTIQEMAFEQTAV